MGREPTPEELAGATGTAPRYVREWLSNQAAGGYVTGQTIIVDGGLTIT